MDIKEIYYRQQERKKKRDKQEKVHLVCDTCGEKVTRPVFIKLTGHLHDQKCTYVCTVCRGNMREVNLNQDEEK
jgi:dihydroorotate dehydrogenase